MGELRTDSPGEFAADLLGALETADRGRFSYPMQPLSQYETAEELVLDLIPNPDRELR